MILVKIILFIASIIGIVIICRKFVVDLGFPGSLIEAMKQYVCPFCGKKYWTPYGECSCHDTPEYKAWLRQAKRKWEQIESKQPRRSYHSRERNCPRCKGQPGYYSCPMCEGRGKTFM